MRFSSVDLPDPDGPARLTNSPGATSRSTPLQRVHRYRVGIVGAAEIAAPDDQFVAHPIISSNHLRKASSGLIRTARHAGYALANTASVTARRASEITSRNIRCGTSLLRMPAQFGTGGVTRQIDSVGEQRDQSDTHHDAARQRERHDQHRFDHHLYDHRARPHAERAQHAEFAHAFEHRRHQRVDQSERERQQQNHVPDLDADVGDFVESGRLRIELAPVQNLEPAHFLRQRLVRSRAETVVAKPHRHLSDVVRSQQLLQGANAGERVALFEAVPGAS